MPDPAPKPSQICRYFVDEAGDGVLFDRKGNVLIDQEGFPRHFILGMVELADQPAVERDLARLRADVLADPYFKDVPSIRPEARKTALHFHAKDDLPEVRREVFKLLARHEIRFFAAVKSMASVRAYVQSRNAMDSAYRYTPNELYDLTVRMLFKERLHQQENYEVIFGRRGKSDRSRALQQQLEVSRRRFLEHVGRSSETQVAVVPAYPHEQPGLQVVDYCLWALQRLYERKEDRFLQLLWPKVSFLHDVDDQSRAGYGRYYTRNDPPLSAAEMERRRV